MIEKYLEIFRKKGPAALARLSNEEQTAVATWARKVVDQYISTLTELSAKIKDIDTLPFPKETIKIAIKTLMPAYALTDSEDMLDLLKDRYIRLSSFQEIKQEEKKPGDTDAGDPNQTLHDSETEFASTHQKYIQLALSEEKILLEDITAFMSSLD